MSRPQDNPKEPARLTKQRDESDETDMSKPDTETELEAMNVRLKDENLYQVGNPAEGTAYLVNMHNADHEGTMTCTCPDYRFRAQEGEHRACKHIQRVIQVSPSEITTDHLAFRQLVREYEILSDKVDTVTQRLTSSQSETVSQTQQSQSVPASDAAGDGSQMQQVSVEEAAQKLRDAYAEYAPEGTIEVIVKDGQLWPNTKKNAPDWVFNSFLKGKLEWDADGNYDHPVTETGYELENYLPPEKVDSYISEVLE